MFSPSAANVPENGSIRPIFTGAPCAIAGRRKCQGSRAREQAAARDVMHRT